MIQNEAGLITWASNYTHVIYFKRGQMYWGK